MLTSPVKGGVQHTPAQTHKAHLYMRLHDKILETRLVVWLQRGRPPLWWSDLHYRETEWEKEKKIRDRGWERKRSCAGEKLNQWLNYCMIAHSPKTWASFGRKCLIIGFRPCQTHAFPPTNGSVWKIWASWVREGQKIARRQNAPYALLLFFLPQTNEGTGKKKRHREKKRWQEGGRVYVSEEEMKWQ